MRGRKEKLSDLQKQELVAKAKEGYPSAVLCEQFHISRPLVNRILRQNGIIRNVGKQHIRNLYYYEYDPVITLTPESFNWLMSEFKTQGIQTPYLLRQKVNVSNVVAHNLFEKHKMPMNEMRKMLNALHIYVTLTVAEPQDEPSVRVNDENPFEANLTGEEKAI